jgi:hypothetical protein
MKIVATHSHFNGLEFIYIHQKAVWTALAAIVRRISNPDFLGHELLELLTAGGWSCNGAGEVRPLTKSGVAVKPSFDLRSANLEEHFDGFVASYRRSEFDVCVLILADGQRNSASLAELVHALGRNGRNGFGVPLVLMSIGPAAVASARKVPAVRRRPNRSPVEKPEAAAKLL